MYQKELNEKPLSSIAGYNTVNSLLYILSTLQIKLSQIKIGPF